MAEGNWSVVRVEKISAEGAQKTERHNERKNESYANLNVDTEQIARNVHFKDTGGLTYNEYFQRLIDEGKISTRGQKAGATIFNELVIDVNTRYFEEHGGYEYARQFYGEAYRFGCEIYGEENIVSAVMHAYEINKAVSEELGKPVYHYHLHIVAIPTVRKNPVVETLQGRSPERNGQGGHQPSFPLKEVEEHRSSAGRKRAAGYQQIRKADVPQVLFCPARQALCTYDRSGIYRL